jgi:hypothetical protein
VQAAVECVVRFDDEAARDLALEAGVELVAFRDPQRRVEPAREVCPFKNFLAEFAKKFLKQYYP